MQKMWIQNEKAYTLKLWKIIDVEYLNIQYMFFHQDNLERNGKDIEKIHTATLSHIIIKKLVIIIIE
jgi:hypothetical protein